MRLNESSFILQFENKAVKHAVKVTNAVGIVRKGYHPSLMRLRALRKGFSYCVRLRATLTIDCPFVRRDDDCS